MGTSRNSNMAAVGACTPSTALKIRLPTALKTYYPAPRESNPISTSLDAADPVFYNDGGGVRTLIVNTAAHIPTTVA